MRVSTGLFGRRLDCSELNRVPGETQCQPEAAAYAVKTAVWSALMVAPTRRPWCILFVQRLWFSLWRMCFDFLEFDDDWVIPENSGKKNAILWIG